MMYDLFMIHCILFATILLRIFVSYFLSLLSLYCCLFSPLKIRLEHKKFLKESEKDVHLNRCTKFLLFPVQLCPQGHKKYEQQSIIIPPLIGLARFIDNEFTEEGIFILLV